MDRRRLRHALAALCATALAAPAAALTFAAPATAATTTASRPPMICTGDGASGNRVQLLYIYETGRDYFALREAGMRQAAWEAQQNINDSARRDGGQQRILRFVHGADCQVSIAKLQVAPGAISGDPETWYDSERAAYPRGDRFVVGLVEGWHGCGGTGDDGGGSDFRKGTDNLHNQRAVWANFSPGCLDGHVVTHEITHGLGGMSSQAPNSDGGAHCTDGQETLCQNTSSLACPDPINTRLLDCGEDDYFSLAPKSDWLREHFNGATDSLYLDAVPTLKPMPTLLPLSPQYTRVTDQRGGTISVSFRLPGDHTGITSYGVRVDGNVLVSVAPGVSTARVGGLGAGTHVVDVVSRTADGRTSAPSPSTTIVTGSGGGVVGTPTNGSTLVWTNGTGLALEMPDAKPENGTAARQENRGDSFMQQWQYGVLADGSVTLRSSISGRCLTADGYSPTAAVVQQPCDTWAPTQRWWVTQVSTTGSAPVLTLRSLASNACLQAAGGSTGAGTPLVLGSCSTGAPPRWWTPHLL
ncbi:MAG: RICIN domain-containing protein [Kineosporiaceae bacterium]